MATDTNRLAIKGDKLYVSYRDIACGCAKWKLNAGSGSTNTNLGGKIRIAIEGTNNIKTLDMGAGIKYDTAGNVITIAVDTTTIPAQTIELIQVGDMLRLAVNGVVLSEVTNSPEGGTGGDGSGASKGYIKARGTGRQVLHVTNGDTTVYHNTFAAGEGMALDSAADGTLSYKVQPGTATSDTTSFKPAVWNGSQFRTLDRWPGGGGGDANLVVQPIGGSGYSMVVISGDTFYYRRIRDSTGIGVSIAPDGALVFRLLSPGIGSLNSLTSTTQTFATGTSGTDFNISSTGSTHTFNLPSASVTARGLTTTAAQTFAGLKTFQDNIKVGKAGLAGRIEFGRSSDGATVGYVDVVNGFMTLNGVSGSRAVIASNGNARLLATNVGVSVGLGGNAPTYSFEVDWTDAMKLPKGSTVQRPTTTTSGIQRWNNDSSAIELHNGTIWQTIATRDWARSNLSGSTGGSFTYTLNKDSVIADAAAIPIGINPTTGRLARVPDQTVSLVRGTSGAEKDSIYAEIAGVKSRPGLASYAQLRYSSLTSVTVAGTVVSASPLSVLGTGSGTNVLPAGSFAAGDVIVVRGQGTYTTNTTDNILNIDIGFGSGANYNLWLQVTLPASMTGRTFDFEISFVPRAITSTASVAYNAKASYTTDAVATSNASWQNIGTGLNFTGNVDVRVGMHWSVSDSGDSATVDNVSVEVKKGNW